MQQAFGAEVFIDVGPMDAVSTAGDFPVRALLRRCFGQPGIPRQGHGNTTAVHETDRQHILGYFDILYALISAQCQSNHKLESRRRLVFLGLHLQPNRFSIL